MKTTTHTLGIDIAKRNFEVNLRRLDSVEGRCSASFANNSKGFQALQRWLLDKEITQPALLHACLESTSRYGDGLAAWLSTQGYPVSMVNPRRTRHYADSQLTRTVNDRIDARLIADFCAEKQDRLALWQPLPDAHRQLQDLTRARQALLKHREGLGNLLETATGMARRAIQRQVANLQREIRRLDQAIEELLDQPACAQLKAQVALADSVPAVGPLTAAIVVAELPPIDKIATAQQAIALFGLDPKCKTSGSSVKTPARLSKMGSKRGRRALYMPALVALRHNPLVRALGQRLKDKGRCGKYIVVAAMRKLLRQIFGVIKSGQRFDAEWTIRRPKPTEQPA
jgi:transposase